MKNLANCKPSEFLAQTYKMKGRVEKFFREIEFGKIRAQVPEIVPVPSGASEEEVEKITAENKRRMRSKGLENAMQVLDAALSTNAEDTLALLAMSCFVEPENVDDHPIGFYLEAFSEIMSDSAVISFFTSLAQLGVKNTGTVPEK